MAVSKRLKATTRQLQAGELTEENVDQFADAAIDNYFAKGMIVDAMLWSRIVGIYKAKIKGEKVSLKRARTVKTLVIDRDRWLRGGVSATCLLNRNGKMCCLGFYALALGFQEEHVIEVPQPCEVGKVDTAKFPAWLVRDFEMTGAGSDLMNANDALGGEVKDEKKREKEIRALFKKHGGVTVRFVDGKK